MSDEIRVRVVEFTNKRHFQAQWNDPDEVRPDGTPKIHTRSTGIDRRPGKRGRDEAQRFAERLQAELNANAGRTAGRVRWEAFRERYESEHACVPNLRESTVAQLATIFDRFEQEMTPQYLKDITGATLSKHAQRLRNASLAEATIKKHLSHLLAAFRWARKVGLMRDIPARPATPNARRSLGEKPKGRPVASLEFERWSAAVAVVMECKGNAIRTQDIRRIMDGLLFSGLRLEELMILQWEADADISAVFAPSMIPVIAINSPRAQKNHCVTELPMTPEFEQLLSGVPTSARHGYVFSAEGKKGRLTAPAVGRIIAAAGKAAGIKVGWYERTRKPKYASAHDLRRSFCDFYKQRLTINELKELMRHSSIATTNTYYLSVEAQSLGQKLRAAPPRELFGLPAKPLARKV
jgi:integrase